MRSGDCFIIVYSITDYKTFEEAQSIFEFTKRIRGENAPVVRGKNTLTICSYTNGKLSYLDTLGTECPDRCGVLISGIDKHEISSVYYCI